eukprot:4722360-Pleurochrysis_carterae.AAC.1
MPKLKKLPLGQRSSAEACPGSCKAASQTQASSLPPTTDCNASTLSNAHIFKQLVDTADRRQFAVKSRNDCFTSAGSRGIK